MKTMLIRWLVVAAAALATGTTTAVASTIYWKTYCSTENLGPLGDKPVGPDRVLESQAKQDAKAHKREYPAHQVYQAWFIR
jgi:hypothetical protein